MKNASVYPCSRSSMPRPPLTCSPKGLMVTVMLSMMRIELYRSKGRRLLALGAYRDGFTPYSVCLVYVHGVVFLVDLYCFERRTPGASAASGLVLKQDPERSSEQGTLARDELTVFANVGIASSRDKAEDAVA